MRARIAVGDVVKLPAGYDSERKCARSVVVGIARSVDRRTAGSIIVEDAAGVAYRDSLAEAILLKTGPSHYEANQMGKIHTGAANAGQLRQELEPYFRRPFVQATMKGAPCLCVGCGAEEHATQQVSEYPNRFVPATWSQDAHTGALRCQGCTDMSEAVGILVTDFWRESDVLFSPDGRITTIDRPIPDLTNTEANEGTTMTDTTPHARRARRLQEEHDAPQEEPTIKDRVKDQAKEIGAAMALGGQLVAVNQGGELMLRIAQKVALKSPAIAALLNDEDGREVAKAIVAFGLHSAGTHMPLPKGKAALRKIGSLQMTASTFILGSKYSALFMEEIEGLIGLGEKLSEEPLGAFTAGSAETVNLEGVRTGRRKSAVSK